MNFVPINDWNHAKSFIDKGNPVITGNKDTKEGVIFSRKLNEYSIESIDTDGSNKTYIVDIHQMKKMYDVYVENGLVFYVAN